MPPNQPSSSGASIHPSSSRSGPHDDELESLFLPQFHQGPGFQLSSWSSCSAENTTMTTSPTITSSSRHARSCKSGVVSLPFANVDDEMHDDSNDDDDNEDDADSDDSMSCDWSLESDNDSNFMAEAQREAEKVLEEPSLSSRRRVRFSDSILIRCFQKPEVEDVPQLYYSAHELQKIIDDYVSEQQLAATLICPCHVPQPVAP